ncbi:hypothetical protein [Flocculibacter collagenilyticus]|uniref:hypothetical protein n=1 Tax=Flocculibacter collagenilyticus TaxID=2744479 RepID=UPI0018F52C06|nr:hypothetical protein [Flocculibacter collagenilyticus]
MLLTPRFKALSFLFFSIIFSEPMYADTNDVNHIVDKVIKAYGGTKLTQANSIKIIDYNKGPWRGESEVPNIHEIWRINEELTIDFKNKRKSLLTYRVPRTTIDLEKWIVSEDKAIAYDILHGKYAVHNWAKFDSFGGFYAESSSDTLYAKSLNENRQGATFSGKETYRGRVHQKLNIENDHGWTLTYYIDKQAGVIRKLIRLHASGRQMVYVFSNHQQSKGVTYARDMNLLVDGELNLVSIKRDIEMLPDLDNEFKHYEHFVPWGEEFYTNKITAKMVANGVYQAGKGRDRTVFIENKDYLIAIGSAKHLQANYKQFKELTGSEKAIKFYVVTHHHGGNLRGLNNAVEMGATLVVSEAHQQLVIDSLSSPLAKEKLTLVSDRKPLTIADLKLFDIATAHSQHYLVSYLESEKLVIADEHYETNLKTGKPRIFKDMVVFHDAIKKLDIRVEHLIDFRSLRLISIDELESWTQNFEPKRCPPGYAICEKG